MCEEASNDYWKRAGRALRDFVTGDRPLFLRRSREWRRLRRVPTSRVVTPSTVITTASDCEPCVICLITVLSEK